jgi:ATP phosphoribosyltransferase regulatory subunit HisZ
MKETHKLTLHKLLEFIKKTEHDLVEEVEETPTLKAFWDSMIEEIPDLITDLEEILTDAEIVATEAGEVILEAGEIL